MNHIKITGAREGNLKNVTFEIPKNKLVVFTGLSGSGKSTLLVDVLFNECQRQYLEAMSMEGIHKPMVERIQGAAPAILITQTNANSNPRSTVGTMTDVYTDLRMVYEKLGRRKCPHCGGMISAADCKEETEKVNSDFYVYMYCSKCGKRMDKITRTLLSFNTREGACPACEGLGRIHSVKETLVVEETLALEEGAVRYWEKQYGKYQISILYAAYKHYGIPVPSGIPVKEFSDVQKAMLYDGVESSLIRERFPAIKPPKNTASGKFEGAVPILWRRFAEKEGDGKQLENYFDIVECPQCRGERLGEVGRSVVVHNTRLPELAKFSLEKLNSWVRDLETSLAKQHFELVEAYLRDIKTKLRRFLNVGLGYLTLDRQIITLSGGELQRLRLAAVLDCELTGMIYILDEPTAGLHPKDTSGLVTILKNLRDLGNSVLVIEHDEDVMAAADYIVDIGPGSGKYGGKVIAAGTLEEIKDQAASVTGNYLRIAHPGKSVFRKPTGEVTITNADKFNLKGINAEIPTGCLTAVTGPSGSGKSTLIFEVLGKNMHSMEKDAALGQEGDRVLGQEGDRVLGQEGDHVSGQEGDQLPDREKIQLSGLQKDRLTGQLKNQFSGQRGNYVSGLEVFDDMVEIRQSPITRMKRSNVATYSEVYSEIRAVFAKTEGAKSAGLTARHFSFNTPGGRCENCEGLGYVDSNMLFFNNIEVLCPVCNGRRFQEKVLEVTYQGRSIKEVLDMSVDDAADFLGDQPRISRILTLLQDVGLGYLELGQTLTTLSGGEGQRLKLAKELIGSSADKRTLYLMDEPTTGLHPRDVEHFMVLLDRLVNAGNTVVVVEHNQQLIKNSDWVIDLGPEGGEKGGEVVFAGTPGEMARTGRSITAKYL